MYHPTNESNLNISKKIFVVACFFVFFFQFETPLWGEVRLKCIQCKVRGLVTNTDTKELLQYKSKETPQLIGLFSPNLVITNFMQCFLYGPIG